MTIADLQTAVANDQANLQATNNTLTAATATYQEAYASGNQANIESAMDAVTEATQAQQQAQNQLNVDQAALDAAVSAANTAQQPVPPTPADVAPENAQAPETFDPYNGEPVTDYSTPTSAQLTSEAASKVATTGLTSSLTNITQGTSIVTANGMASAVNTATGQVVANLGAVTPDGNTLPANTLPNSSSDNTQAFKVTISQEPTLTGDAAAQLTNNQVIFNVMPTISESRDAAYKAFTPIQHPGEILKYEGSSSRQWGISARLISRTVAEADLNLAYINLIRSWTMPFYGIGTGNNAQTAQYLGAPPPVLTLTAYGNQMIGPVKCVLLNYNWVWPNEVDYIHTSGGVPFPVIVDVSLSMKESFSPNEYSNFDLLQYRNGNLPAAFGGATASQMSALGQSTPASTTQPTTPSTPNNPSAVDTSQSPAASQSALASASGPQQAAATSAGGGTSVSFTPAQLAALKNIQVT